MNPSLHDGDYILVSRAFWKPSIRDVVAFKHPASGLPIVKRIAKLTPSGAYVLGDNAMESDDSRSFGTVELKSLLGRVIAVI